MESVGAPEASNCWTVAPLYLLRILPLKERLDEPNVRSRVIRNNYVFSALSLDSTLPMLQFPGFIRGFSMKLDILAIAAFPDSGRESLALFTL